MGSTETVTDARGTDFAEIASLTWMSRLTHPESQDFSVWNTPSPCEPRFSSVMPAFSASGLTFTSSPPGLAPPMR